MQRNSLRGYRPRATILPSNDSALFPFRFVDVHSRTVRDWQRNQFFEVPSRLSGLLPRPTLPGPSHKSLRKHWEWIFNCKTFPAGTSLLNLVLLRITRFLGGPRSSKGHLTPAVFLNSHSLERQHV
jgi:hypothetical protein